MIKTNVSGFHNYEIEVKHIKRYRPLEKIVCIYFFQLSYMKYTSNYPVLFWKPR